MAKTIKQLEREIERLKREFNPIRPYRVEIYEDIVLPDGTHKQGKLIRQE